MVGLVGLASLEMLLEGPSRRIWGPWGTGGVLQWGVKVLPLGSGKARCFSRGQCGVWVAELRGKCRGRRQGLIQERDAVARCGLGVGRRLGLEKHAVPVPGVRVPAFATPAMGVPESG